MPGGGLTGFTVNLDLVISSNVAIGFVCPSSFISKSSLVSPVTCSSRRPWIRICCHGLARCKTTTGTVTSSVRTVNLGTGGGDGLYCPIIAVESAVSIQVGSKLCDFSLQDHLTHLCSCVEHFIRQYTNRIPP